MSWLEKVIITLLSLPKTIKFNLHYFGIKKGMKMPILISYKVKLSQLGEKGSLECPEKFMSVKLGFSNGSFSMGRGKSSTFSHEYGSKIKFNGKATLCNPFYLTINHGGMIEFGSDFKSNTNFVLSSAQNIKFGQNCLIGWNVTILDGDGHSIFNNNENKIYNYPRAIQIHDNVWISSNVTILKGAEVKSNSIISSNTLVCEKFKEENIIIGGIPGKKIKEQINWKEEWI